MNITPENLTAVTGAVAPVLAGIGAWLSRKAVKNTKATSNGFASSVTTALTRIEQKIDDHIAAHADANIRSKP